MWVVVVVADEAEDDDGVGRDVSGVEVWEQGGDVGERVFVWVGDLDVSQLCLPTIQPTR